MSFLDTLIYGYRQIFDGSNVLLLQRNKIKFVGAGSVLDDAVNGQTVVTLTGSSSLGFDGSGFSNITGNVKNTSNPKVTSIEYVVNVAPPGVNTAVTALTIPTSTGKVYTIRGIVSFHNASANAYGDFEINAFANNVLGTVTLLSNTVTNKASNASFVVALSVSGTNILVSVTDPAGSSQSRRITGSVYVAERSF